jgi:alpha-tubulin suppressor-like RCC1 family protein
MPARRTLALAIATALLASCAARGPAPMVAVGSDFVLALASNGQVWSWGRDDRGQTGQGAGETKILAPGLVVDQGGSAKGAHLAGVVSIAASRRHAVAVKADGTVWAWGEHGGPGKFTVKPEQVAGLSGCVAVAVGDDLTGDVFFLALGKDGRVWSWGWGPNVGVQLGIGAADKNSTPHPPQPIPGLSEVKAIAAGEYHGLALKRDGTVWAWGWNASCQLGDGTTKERAAAARVAGAEGAIAIAAWSYGSMAVRSDGTVLAWGDLIPGGRAKVPTPVPGISDVVAAAWGEGHVLFLEKDGSVWAVGRNSSGALGDGSLSDRDQPVRVAVVDRALAVAAGDGFSAVVDAAGSVWTFGRGQEGCLGRETGEDFDRPGRVAAQEGALSLLGSTSRSQPAASATEGQQTGATAGPVASNLIASSTLADAQRPEHYAAINVLDGDPATAWVEGKDDDGIGESVQFDITPPVRVFAVRVMPGFFSGAYWKDNNRVKQARITVTDVADAPHAFTADFADEMIPQMVHLDGYRAKRLEIEIAAVYPGQKYRDTAIAEIWAYGGEYDTAHRLPLWSSPQLASAPPAMKAVSLPGEMGIVPDVWYFYPDGSFETRKQESAFEFGRWTYDAGTGNVRLGVLFRMTKRGVGKETISQGMEGTTRTYESYVDEIAWGGPTLTESWENVAAGRSQVIRGLPSILSAR